MLPDPAGLSTAGNHDEAMVVESRRDRCHSYYLTCAKCVATALFERVSWKAGWRRIFSNALAAINRKHDQLTAFQRVVQCLIVFDCVLVVQRLHLYYNRNKMLYSCSNLALYYLNYHLRSFDAYINKWGNSITMVKNHVTEYKTYPWGIHSRTIPLFHWKGKPVNSRSNYFYGLDFEFSILADVSGLVRQSLSWEGVPDCSHLLLATCSQASIFYGFNCCWAG